MFPENLLASKVYVRLRAQFFGNTGFSLQTYERRKKKVLFLEMSSFLGCKRKLNHPKVDLRVWIGAGVFGLTILYIE